MDKDVKSAFQDAHAAIEGGNSEAAVGAIAPLETSQDPLVLYGVGNVYKVLSDYTYRSVNYTMGGFMYPNADKRNDEYNKNKYNSMRLLSKSKEMMFSSIYIIKKSGKDDDWLYSYINFLAEMKMKRYAQAHLVLGRINKQAQTPVNHYANMIYAVRTGGRDAEKMLKPLLEIGELNAYYYLALHIMERELPAAGKILAKIATKTQMPMAETLLEKAMEVDKATML
jgi:hypothetical protein